MSTARVSERIIDFQNRAEEAFNSKKNLSTILRFFVAYIIFMGSTLLAFATIPLRMIAKQFKKSSSQIFVANNKNIDEFLKKEKLVLIDFWAEWCGPCIMMEGAIKEFAEKSKNIKVAKVNADLNLKTVRKFNIKGLPHFVLVRNGGEVKRFAGSMTLADLNRFCFEEK